MRVFSPISRVALGVCLVTAAAFVGSIGFMPYPGAFVLKVIPILALMVVVAQQLSGSQRKLVLAALLFSGVGDVTLERDIFLLGLGAFLLAQLIYAGLFFRNRHSNAVAWVRAVLVVLMMLVLSANIWPHAGDLQLPVACYMMAIGMMGLAAAFHAPPSFMILAGAISFIISDSLIGFNRFVQPFDGAREAIMVMYYLAQILLVCGIVRFTAVSRAGNSGV